MISRHNIRVKVLQTLYAHFQDEASTAGLAERNYLKAAQNSYRLYLYNLYILQRIADYNQRDYDIKTHKHVPTKADQNASLKFYQNPVVAALRDNEAFQKLLKKELIAPLVDLDLIRNLYQKFAQGDYFPTYVAMANPPAREHQYCLVNLYKLILMDENFQEHMEDHFPAWEEDASLLYAAVKNTIRLLPEDKEFYKQFELNEEFVNDFGKELLYQVIHNEADIQPLINDKLVNWQEDRVALMDMILIKMGVCEFLYHPSIPTKVTIDEYIGISKEYSTDKSKRFINGILDRLMRDLKDKGMISKIGRGLDEDVQETQETPQE